MMLPTMPFVFPSQSEDFLALYKVTEIHSYGNNNYQQNKDCGFSKIEME